MTTGKRRTMEEAVISAFNKAVIRRMSDSIDTPPVPVVNPIQLARRGESADVTA